MSKPVDTKLFGKRLKTGILASRACLGGHFSDSGAGRDFPGSLALAQRFGQDREMTTFGPLFDPSFDSKIREIRRKSGKMGPKIDMKNHEN